MNTETAEAASPNHLRAWRKAAGLTQGQVEKILRWQQARLSRLEQGKASLTDQVLAALAPLYGCEPADLLHDPPAQKARAKRKPRKHPHIAALHEAERTMRKLLDEFHAIKADLVPRLEALEEQMTAINVAVVEAVNSAVEASAMLAHTASVLNEATGKKPRAGRVERRVTLPADGS